jgi:hypothetical protein
LVWSGSMLKTIPHQDAAGNHIQPVQTAISPINSSQLSNPTENKLEFTLLNMNGKALWEVKVLALVPLQFLSGMLTTMEKPLSLTTLRLEDGPNHLSNNTLETPLFAAQELTRVSID